MLIYLMFQRNGFVVKICILEISNFGFRRKELWKFQTFKIPENVYFNICQI